MPLGKQFYQLGTGGDTERLHACMSSPVYGEEAEFNHRCLITSIVMCLTTAAKCETLAEPCCQKIHHVLTNFTLLLLLQIKDLPKKLLTIDCYIRLVFVSVCVDP